MSSFTRILPAVGLLALACMVTAADDPVQPPQPTNQPPATPSWEFPPEALARAQARVKAWEEEAPEKAKRVLRVCYWSPAGRAPLADSTTRLTRVMRHIQDFYLRELRRNGFPGRSIGLALAADGQLDITYVEGRLTVEQCEARQGGAAGDIRKDCAAALAAKGIKADEETLMIFCNLSDWDPEQRTLRHYSPYLAVGDSLSGTGWVVDSAILDAKSLGVRDQFVHDAQHGRASLGRYNSIFIGGTCLQVGLAMGLPHSKETAAFRKVRGISMMGGGNYTYAQELRGEGLGSSLMPAEALRLAVHPLCSSSVKRMSTKAVVAFDDMDFEVLPEGLRITGRATGNLPLVEVIAYGDPDGGGDYDAQIAGAVPDDDGRFSLVLPHAEKPKAGGAELRLVGVCVNGSATFRPGSGSAWEHRMFTGGDGRWVIDSLKLQLAWGKVADAHQAGRLAAGSEARNALPGDFRETLERLERPDGAAGKPAPSMVPAAQGRIALSDCAPVFASTGWQGVHYDRTCDGTALIGSRGPARHGLWAHANAEHTYDLGGQWKILKGYCGLLAGGHTLPAFTILLDGKQVWSSADHTDGAYSLDLTDVTLLTLRCRAENKSGAWGGWLEPELSR